MKVFFNTKTFDDFLVKGSFDVTTHPEEAELLVLGAKKVDYPSFTMLKAVYRFGVGSENVDFAYLRERNIAVHFPSENAKQSLYDAVANFTVYGIFFLFYRGAFGDSDAWKKTERDEFLGKRALVIGAGNIGRKVAQKLSPFMEVETYDSTTHAPDMLMSLVKTADVITVHLPSTDATKKFFNKERLSWVKDDAIIANTARGDLFDEDALYEKLSQTNCRAFFDVFWQEPYHGKLKDLGQDKFFMTPHSASNTKVFVREGWNDILTLIRTYAVV